MNILLQTYSDSALLQTELNKQSKINYICSCLLKSHIQNSEELFSNFESVMLLIKKNTTIFDGSETESFQIFQKAVKAYNKVTDAHIQLLEGDFSQFAELLSLQAPEEEPPLLDELSRVTQSYDRLAKAHHQIDATHSQIIRNLEKSFTATCRSVILGSGDTGTTMWLQKYRPLHRQTQVELAQGNLPPLLMIGGDFGCWRHDYTLAQPHSLLERTGVESNPSDYVSRDFYTSNPYTNARHIYQANMVNLGETDAPLLQKSTVLAIQTKNNYPKNWNSQHHEYRLIIQTPVGIKVIYTHEIDICTGLGPAKDAISEVLMPQKEFALLSKYAPDKKFTPIIDGNEFMLTATQEQSQIPRTIVVYGGGGTAAACYRKGFFGTDVRTEGRPFSDESQRNRVLWISARGFEAAGSGTLVKAALAAAKSRHELLTQEIGKISYNPHTQKLTLDFIGGLDPIECDQLVYSLGQDAAPLRKVVHELEKNLVLDYDSTKMPLAYTTNDRRIHFFGAAAMAIRPKEYAEATWKWLRAENIGPDVGPGSMPPSRAQIKKALAIDGIPPESINVNMDNSQLIGQFLIECGAPTKAVHDFIKDILDARKQSTAGFPKNYLEALLEKHQLNDYARITGHCHLEKA